MPFEPDPTAPAAPSAGSDPSPDSGASPQVGAPDEFVVPVVPVPGARRAYADGGSMRPLFVFLVAAAVALVGSIVFALVQAGNGRELEELTAARAEVVAAVDKGRTAQDGLAEQIAAAEQALAATKGKVPDDAVRAELAKHVAAAKELGTAAPPTVPAAGAAGLEAPEDVDALEAQATEWATTMRTTSSTLVAATEDVLAATKEWQQQRKAAQEKAKAEAERAARKAADLKTATARLTAVSDQLKISVRDARYTLDWTASVGAPADVRTTLSEQRAEGQAALGTGADMQDPASVTKLTERREAARAAIEKAAWDARATVADGTNGRLALDTLCKVGVGPEGQDQYLRCDAAQAWKKLGLAFEATFGKPLRVEYGYRPYDWQLQALDEFGSGQVAAPGTSNHGWALAVDVPVDDGFRFGQPEYEWLAAHGPNSGWVHPGWARAGGGREEPWHFEYVG
ncbi:M15 family metallopeptidase [Promicromonospora thailandica]|uniref:D-alanyl-D-alanine carboxypeptidase n=1 Tax=Promicromonospora thailandica TaxID=765201 RepID=A0A9X2G4A3_9MICO|nr:M15 family metallopeptidase [Promicromonospora thailandica]MCP2265288.1 D-alanyl-D-alanine carboxypeptidase [Promicromonospora thailandica]